MRALSFVTAAACCWRACRPMPRATRTTPTASPSRASPTRRWLWDTPIPTRQRTHLARRGTFTFRAVNNGLSSIQVNGDNMPQISGDLTSGTGGKTFQIGGSLSVAHREHHLEHADHPADDRLRGPGARHHRQRPRRRFHEQPVPGLGACHRQRRHLDLRSGAFRPGREQQRRRRAHCRQARPSISAPTTPPSS